MRYKVKKLGTRSVKDSNGWYLAVVSHYEVIIDFIRSLEGIFFYKLKKLRSGQVSPIPYKLTDSKRDFEIKSYSAPYK